MRADDRFVAMWQVMLDMRMVIGNRIGLDAVLPNMTLNPDAYNPDYVFTLSPNERYRHFHGDIDFLPFNPNGRIVYVGSVRQSESVYIVMVPRNQIGRTVGVGHKAVFKKVKIMDAKSARGLFVMLAYMLAKINFKAIIGGRYPSLESDEAISEFACNILYVSSSL